jgi:hypothetical protein
MSIKAGTRIELRGRDMNMNEVWEAATIGKWLKISGPRKDAPEGYHRVIFKDGGSLLCHESGFRVVDNRA